MASLEKPRKIEKTVRKMRKLQEGNSWKTVGAQEKGWEKGMKWRKGKALKKLGTYRQAYWKNERSEAQRRAASVGVRSKTVCKRIREEFLGEESLGEKYMGAKYMGEKSVGERYMVDPSVGEK